MSDNEHRYVLTIKGREAIGLPITVADLVDVWGPTALRWSDKHLPQIVFPNCLNGLHSDCDLANSDRPCGCACHS